MPSETPGARALKGSLCQAVDKSMHMIYLLCCMPHLYTAEGRFWAVFELHDTLLTGTSLSIDTPSIREVKSLSKLTCPGNSAKPCVCVFHPPCVCTVGNVCHTDQLNVHFAFNRKYVATAC